MKPAQLKSEALLLAAAVIWGFAFVAQRSAMRDVGPFVFNGVRFALGALFLLPLAVRASRRAAAERVRFAGGERAGSAPAGAPAVTLSMRGFGRSSLLWGGAAGTAIFCGASLQQVGIVYTTAGKAGFITGLYMVLVPILGLAIGRRTRRATWAGAVTAAAGLYLLSFSGPLRISPGDLLVLGGTFFWAVHVLLIGAISRRFEPLVIAVAQYAVCALLSLAVSAAAEKTSVAGLTAAAIPILYGGLLSVGIAYTLQIFAQRRLPPGHAAIILSLETVFAALGGWMVLGETIPPRGIAGCALMLTGILVSQADQVRARGRRAITRH